MTVLNFNLPEPNGNDNRQAKSLNSFFGLYLKTADGKHENGGKIMITWYFCVYKKMLDGFRLVMGML